MTYRQAMLETARELKPRGSIVFATGYTFALTDEHIMAFSVDEGTSGASLLGATMAAHYTLELANERGQWLQGGELLAGRPLIGAVIALELGVYHDGAYEYMPAGQFVAGAAKATEGGTRITISGDDVLATAFSGAFADAQAYPRTLAQIFEHVKSQAAVPVGGALACNAEAVIAAMPDWGEDCTVREALGYVAAAGGCFVRVNRAGAVELVPLRKETAAAALTPAHYMQLECNNDSFAFNRLNVTPKGAKDVLSVYGS